MEAKQLLYAIGWVNDEYIEEMDQPASSKRNIRLTILLVAAILISILGIGVYAVEHILPTDYWLYRYFSSQTTSDSIELLTENQQDILDRALVRIDQNVESNGYTITLESGISDGKRLFLKFVITAPDGTILGGDGYSLEGSSNIEMPHKVPDNYSIHYKGGKLLDDGNPNDNCVSILREEIFIAPTDTDFSLSDGTQWQFHFNSILEYGTANGEPTESIIAEGNWDFSITFSEDILATQSVELLQDPIRCSAKRSWGNESYDIKVKVTSVKLKPLSTTICYNKPLTGFWEGVMLDPIYLVMKDGSRIEAQFRLETNRGSYMEVTYLFDRPISIDDIAYVDYPYAGEVAVSNSN